MELPKISIVTPSFNQGQFIEQTIQSVLDQGYPNFEYIVIDGGSTDETLKVIEKYAKHLKYWVSEKDRGQTHAINKGFKQATGQIFAYINSDDYYLPGAFNRVANTFTENPEVDLIHGAVRITNENGQVLRRYSGDISNLREALDVWEVWWKGRAYKQPEVFWRKTLADRVGEWNEDLYYVMDFEYWIRCFQEGAVALKVDEDLCSFRTWAGQKTSVLDEIAEEQLEVLKCFLWEPLASVEKSEVRRLRGRWAYQTKVLPLMEQLSKHNASFLWRAMSVGIAIAQSPSLMYSEALWQRSRLSRKKTS